MNQEQNLNIANIVTGLRFVLGLPLIYYVYIGEMWIGGLLYVAFLMLDVLDGHAARKFGCVTLLGRNLDFITDGAIGTGVVAALLVNGRMSILYLLLVVIPMLAKTVYIIKGVRDGSFVSADWSKLNGAVLFMIPLMFIIGMTWSIVVAYLLLVFVYVSCAKYIVEIRKLISEGNR